MKKIILMSFVASIAMMAGGNVSSDLPAVAKVANQYQADDTFFDDRTGLMWQDEKYTPKEYGAFKNNKTVGKVGNHRHAVVYCRSLNYAGYSDWRLPTKAELMEVHRIFGQVFKHSSDNDFWTSTPGMGSKYYVVYPSDAYPYERKPSQSNYIRCVRGGN